jgi:hypothetical protein
MNAKAPELRSRAIAVKGAAYWLGMALAITLASTAFSETSTKAHCLPNIDLFAVALPMFQHFTSEHLKGNLGALWVVTIWGLSCGVRPSDALAWLAITALLNLWQAFPAKMSCIYGLSGVVYGAAAIASLRLIKEPSSNRGGFSVYSQASRLTILLKILGAVVLCAELIFLLLSSSQLVTGRREPFDGHISIEVDFATHWIGFGLGCIFAMLGNYFPKNKSLSATYDTS